ncbi:MAG: GAF domain-containing protein [Gammaproteobacteria bacterium]
MHQRFTLKIVISAFIVVCCAYASWTKFHTFGFPFSVTVVNANTAVIQATPGFSLPAGIQAGDHIDLPALDRLDRAALTNFNLQINLPAGLVYHFIIRRDARRISIPITSIDLGVSQRVRIAYWAISVFYLLMGLLALLALWRGRGRAARYMTWWLTFFVLGFAISGLGLEGIAGLNIQVGAVASYTLARIAFYLMIETLVGTILTARMLMLVRASFVLVLAAGVIVMIGGPVTYILYGWAGLVQPGYGAVFTAGYLIPAVLLILSYSHATLAQRPQIRWLLLSIATLLAGIFVSNTFVFDIATNAVVQSTLFVLCMSGFAYTVLRLKVVDVSVVIDRTLVYGGIIALVVGVLAAINALAQHAALGTNASLLLQIIVPLSLGIVLSRIRVYAERIVDQVFFRKKYLSEKALRLFARHCGKYEQADHLYKAAVGEIHRLLGALGCAIYERKGKDYVCVNQRGEIIYPASVGIDDPAFVATRSETKESDLSDLQSILGRDGYVFPMSALGELQGVLVCANRPGEHYAADERKLLTYVAHQMGMALYALRMRARDKLIGALASGLLPVSPEIQAKARELVYVTE